MDETTKRRLSRAEVEHVAHLARLQLSPDEVEAFTRQLDKILEHMQVLNELDTTDVPPTYHVLPGLTNVFREDVPGPSLPREEVLANAPASADGAFLVPRVIE